MATAELVGKNQFRPVGLDSFAGSEVVKKLLILGVIAAAVYTFYVGPDGAFDREGMVVIGIVFAVLTIVDPVYGFVALVVAIGISPDSVIYNNVRLEDYLIPPLFIICFFKKMSSSKELIGEDVMRNVKIYMAIALFSTVKGILMETVWTMTMAVTFYLKYVEYFIVMWLGMNGIKKREDYLTIIIASFFTCAAVGYLAYSGRQDVLEAKSAYAFVRASGPQGETPNVMGGYYLIHIMLAFALVFAARNYVYKLVLMAFLVALAVPLLYTYSRTSFSSVIVGLLVTCLFIDFRYIALIGLLVFCHQLFLPHIGQTVIEDDTFVARYSTIFEIFGDDDSKPSSWTARLMGWYVFYLKTWQSDPFFGRGVGSIGLGIDSSFVKKFVESGIIGVTAFIMILVRLGRLGLEVARESEDHLLKGIAIGYLGILVGISVHAVGVSSFSTIRTAEPFFLFSGVMVGVHFYYKKRLSIKVENEKEKENLKFNAF
jgi:hypothetical protein